MSERGLEAVRSYYSGPATISDGVAVSCHNVEIHARTGQNAITAAWHVVLKERLPRELGSPHGKTLSVRIANGGQGVGTLVDPRLIRGAGEPPSG